MADVQKQIFFLFCAVVILGCPGTVTADIYTYVDSEGVLHFTDTPTSSDYKLYIKERPKRLSSLPAATRYDEIIQTAQERYGIDFSLIKAVIKAESDFNPRAVSKRGAKGLMQIMPVNYNALSVKDPFNPFQNIMGGTLYLKRLFIRYKNRLPLVLAAYNAGPEAVDKYQQIPPFFETQNYVKKVMKLYNQYKDS